MAARRAEKRHPGLRGSWTVATAEALLSGVAVLWTAWYAVAHSDDLDDRLEAFAPALEGLLTLVTVLAAGGLLAHAFGRAEDAVRGWRRAYRDSSGADD